MQESGHRRHDSLEVLANSEFHLNNEVE
jgi:hypothetical protein